MIGLKYGAFTVLEYRGHDKTGKKKMYLCRCICGKEKVIAGERIRGGKLKSCGCIRIVHGYTLNDYDSRIYSIWKNMKQRCFNPNNTKYDKYGGRGIKICDEWKSIQCFHGWAIKNGYSPELCIDRINNDGNYEPSNCRWISNREQQNNTSRCQPITINGISKNRTEWQTFARDNKIKGYTTPLTQGRQAFIQFMQTKIEQGEITL